MTLTPFTVLLCIMVVYLIVCAVASYLFLRGKDCDLSTKITFFLNLASPMFILGAIMIASFTASDL